MNKQPIKKLIFALVLFLGASISTGSQAAIVVIDFNAATTGSLLTINYMEDGFTMERLSGHYDINPSGGTGNTTYLGLDIVEGESLSEVRFTGGIFNLTSLDVMYTTFGGEFQTLKSSAGGNMLLTTAGLENFSGTSWSDLTWITLSSNISIAGPGFDTITFDTVVVPIPAAILLFGSGLAGLIGVARKRRVS